MVGDMMETILTIMLYISIFMTGFCLCRVIERRSIRKVLAEFDDWQNQTIDKSKMDI